MRNEKDKEKEEELDIPIANFDEEEEDLSDIDFGDVEVNVDEGVQVPDDLPFQQTSFFS